MVLNIFNMRYLLLILVYVTCTAQRVAVYRIGNDTAKAIDTRLTAKGADYFFLMDTNGKYLLPATWWDNIIEDKIETADTVLFNNLKDGRPVPYKYK